MVTLAKLPVNLKHYQYPLTPSLTITKNVPDRRIHCALGNANNLLKFFLSRAQRFQQKERPSLNLENRTVKDKQMHASYFSLSDVTAHLSVYKTAREVCVVYCL